MEIRAIIAGKIDRKPKNATPPAMIGMLSALFSAQARLRICFHPRHGIAVGLSAWMPGSSCGVGASAGGRLGSGCPLPVLPAALAALAALVASAAAARRAAFSSTRSRMRSTALSRGLVPVTELLLGCAEGTTSALLKELEGPLSVAGPAAGEPGEGAGPGPVDGGFGGREDGALDRRGQHHLAHPVLALQGRRCVVLVRDRLPDLLEDDAAQCSGQDAADQADRPVGELGSLAQRVLLDVARFRRKTIRPTTSPTSARVAPMTAGGLSR